MDEVKATMGNTEMQPFFQLVWMSEYLYVFDTPKGALMIVPVLRYPDS